MKKLIHLLCLIIFSNSLFSEISDPEGVFLEANRYYDSLKYEDAQGVYETLLNENYISKEIHYNLGNCYYKQGQLASAILHFEKALKLAPNWEKAEKNIEIARKSLADKHEATREGFTQWLSSFVGFSTDFWAWLSILILFFSFLAYVVAKRIKKRFLIEIAKLKFIGFLILFFALVGITIVKFQSENNKSSAIIMNPSVTFKSDPNITSESVFVLHEGSKVVVISSVDGWVEARFGANVGWIEQEVIAFI